jgi:hypothetical protein
MYIYIYVFILIYRIAGTPADGGGRADTPAGGGQADTPAGAML